MADVPVAVLVSGAGSNLVALAAAIARGEVAARIVGVVTDVPTAPVLARAAELGLPALTVPFDRADRPAWEARLADAVAATGAQVVVLAGFMRVLGATFLARWPERVINVHPSLLPAFRGAHAVADALAAGVRVTGVTVHLVDELVDHGPIIAQAACEVQPEDDVASLSARLHPLEHRLLPACVDLVCRGRVRVVAGRAVVVPPPGTDLRVPAPSRPSGAVPTPEVTS